MIVDFYDHLELLSKAVYEIFLVFIVLLPFSLDFLHYIAEENTFYDQQTESRL